MKMYKMTVLVILFLQIILGFLPIKTEAFTPCIESPGIDCPEKSRSAIFFKNTIENIQLLGKYIVTVFVNLIQGENKPEINKAIPALPINILLYFGIIILIYDFIKKYRNKTNNIQNGTKT